MHRSSFIAFLLPFTLLACAVETVPEEGEKTAAEKPAEPKSEADGVPGVVETPANAQRVVEPTPFCLPGEKVSCTLGPPPVCHCAPALLPIEPIRQ